jgi:hypothetical protein
MFKLFGRILNQYDSNLLLLPMLVAMCALAGGLLIKGVDAIKWPEVSV